MLSVQKCFQIQICFSGPDAYTRIIYVDILTQSFQDSTVSSSAAAQLLLSLTYAHNPLDVEEALPVLLLLDASLLFKPNGDNRVSNSSQQERHSHVASETETLKACKWAA